MVCAFFQPPSSHRSFSGACFNAVANARRRLCHPRPASCVIPANRSACRHHCLKICRDLCRCERRFVIEADLVVLASPVDHPPLEVDVRPPKGDDGAKAMARLAGEHQAKVKQRTDLATDPQHGLVLLIREQRSARLVVLGARHAFEGIPLSAELSAGMESPSNDGHNTGGFASGGAPRPLYARSSKSLTSVCQAHATRGRPWHNPRSRHERPMSFLV